MDTEIFNLLNDFNDLTISNDDDEDFGDVELNEIYDETLSNLPDKYNDLVEAVFEIINKVPTFTAEIVDNVIILDNILFGLNPQLDDDNVSIKAILRLSEFHKRKIPQRSDPSWWEEKCSKFEDLMIHLCSTSNDFKNYDKNDESLIRNEIVDFASKIVQKEYEFKEISYEDYDKLRSKLFEFAKYNNYHVERKDEEIEHLCKEIENLQEDIIDYDNKMKSALNDVKTTSTMYNNLLLQYNDLENSYLTLDKEAIERQAKIMQDLKDKKDKISGLEKKLNDSLKEKKVIQSECNRLKILNCNSKLISEKNARIQQQQYEDIVKIYQSEIKNLENIL
ncbi:6621_t:CDS:2, partial [Rhizophagus irregularis]